MAGVRVPIVPDRARVPRHPAVPRRATTATCRRCATPTCWSTTARRAAAWCMGGYERHSAPWSLRPTAWTRSRPTSTAILLEEDWDRFEEIVVNSRRRVPAMEDVKVTRLINGPEALHPRQRVPASARARCAASSWPPASAPTGSPAPAASGKAMAEWIVGRRAGAWTCGRWTSGASARTTARRATRSSARARSTRPTTTSSTPATSARPAGRCGSRAPTPGIATHGAAFGEKSGWERVNWYESNAPRRRRGAAPARLGGPALVAGHRRRARRLPRARRRCSTSPPSPRSRSPGPGAAAFLEWLCDNRVARARRADHLHADAQRPRRHRVRLHRHPPGGRALLDRDRHRLRQPRPRRGSAATRRTTASVRVSDVTSRWACFGLWGPRARDVLAPLTPDPLRLPAT